MAKSTLDDGLAKADLFIIFFAIQNLLTAAVNISKTLWGQPSKAKDLFLARKPLRDALGVSDSSVLRSVVMRNNYEHFDERLDKWRKTSKERVTIDLYLLPSNLTANPPGTRGRGDRIDFFRVYDHHTGELTFWGESFNLKDIIEEVNQLLPKIKSELEKAFAETLSP